MDEAARNRIFQIRSGSQFEHSGSTRSPTKMHNWAKKINRDKEIRNLQLGLVAATGVDIATLSKDINGRPLPPPFIRVDQRSAAGAQDMVSIAHLPIAKLDWDETMHSVISAWVK